MGDINRDADKVNPLKETGPIKSIGNPDPIHAETPTGPVKPIGYTGPGIPSAEANPIYPLRNADGTLKQKFLMRTNKMGVTQEGKFTKTFLITTTSDVKPFLIKDRTMFCPYRIK